MTEIIIPSRKDFVSWLQPRENKRVGYTGRIGSCPIANWLRTRNGRTIGVSNFGGGKAFDNEGNCLPLPTWAEAVAELVDISLESGAVYGYQVMELLKEYEE